MWEKKPVDLASRSFHRNLVSILLTYPRGKLLQTHTLIR